MQTSLDMLAAMQGILLKRGIDTEVSLYHDRTTIALLDTLRGTTIGVATGYDLEEAHANMFAALAESVRSSKK